MIGRPPDQPQQEAARRGSETLGRRRRFPASMESWFKELTLWLASGSEAAAALVIGLATIEATLRALWLFVRPPSRESVRANTRTKRNRSGCGSAAGSPSAGVRVGRRCPAHRGRADLERNR